MPKLSLYAALDRIGLRNYRAKIMVMAFIGTHIPLIALLAYVVAQNTANWSTFVWTLGVALVATLVGTAVTLSVLHHLLHPISLTARALRAYRRDRTRMSLPRGFSDEAGMLMSDAAETMDHLDRAMDMLEHVDEVTSLPNRKRMLGLIDDRMRSDRPFAVAVIRFGDYGRIADTLDLTRAQTATARIAERLRDAINPDGRRGDAVLGALSGSEFALVLPWAEDSRAVTAILMRVMEEVGREMALPDLSLRPVLTSGAALFPTDGADASVLLDHAVAAAAQAGLAAPVVLYSPEDHAAALDRYRMEQDLSRALAQNELEMHYQPVVDLAEERVVGAEALLRWRHPERGMVPPGLFIPVAETSGLIDEIGAWTLRESCRQLGAWSAARRDLRLAVNLSARQFADPDLYRRIKDVVAAGDIDPALLEIELTETAAMADHDHSRTVFGALRDLGMGIAIDDFGTGYASLSTLRSLPFTKLKIDREFVSNIHETAASQAICNSLIALGRGLDLRVLAEGTEMAEEVSFLRNQGCALFQGYYFARPLPSAEFERAVDRLDRDLGLGTRAA